MINTMLNEVTKKLRGHKDTVYTVAYAKDGTRFASGGADKFVIIWSNEGEGKLKYSHNEAIQCLAYNPNSHHLVSCATSDFGLWEPEQNEVKKVKVTSKILCASWTTDGQHLAIGHYSGVISIRNKEGKEVSSVVRKAPIWCLQWNPSREEAFEVLAAGCWDQTLSFYHLSGRQLGKDKQLRFDPCSIAYFSNGEYICIGGSDKKASLYTKDGIRLMTIAEESSWVWSIAHRPNQNYICLGTNDGLLNVYQLLFNTVHSIYQNNYAFRESMTDVVIQDLVTEKQIRIKCKDYIKKIALYKNKVIAQLSDRLYVYEHDGNEEDPQYRLMEKIMKNLECMLLVSTSNHIIQCQESALHMYDFKGVKVREWTLDSSIRYVKVVGGPADREAILVGLKNGVILKIFIDNPFPVQILKLNVGIKCVDLSASRMKLAIVDDNNQCMVYDLKNKKFLFQENNATAVAWNSEYEDMLCFSHNGTLSIKTDNFPVHQHKVAGTVVGFRGYKIFSLQMMSMNTIDIPHSATLFQYIERKEFERAYQIACLGVTDADWKLLAVQSLMGLNFAIARKAFVRIRDFNYIALINKFEKQIQQKSADEQLFLAEIYAYQGRFDESAKLYVKAGHPEVAMDMLCDLRRWKDAKDLAAKNENNQSINLRDLILRQARSAEEDHDLRAAADLYQAGNEYMKAIKIMGEQKWLDNLIDLCRTLQPKTDARAIATCAGYFRKQDNHQYAKEAYMKIGDFSSLMSLHVEMSKWEEAFDLLKTHPEFTADVYLPYAEYLCNQDQFDEAQIAYKKAKKPVEALKMIQKLGFNAVIEHRFRDASYYFWQFAYETISLNKPTSEHCNVSEEEKQDRQAKFEKFLQLAKLYYVYSFVRDYTELPFNSTDIRHLYNISRYLLMNITTETPYNMSKVSIMLSLAKLSTQLGDYSNARLAYQKLQTLRVPKHMRDEIDVQSILIVGKPIANNESEAPICYRCSSRNPSLNEKGDRCTQCDHPFVRSFFSFDTLPLVEFELEDGLSDEEAIKLINIDPVEDGNSSKSQWREDTSNENVQTLSFDDPEPVQEETMNGGNNGKMIIDPFARALLDLSKRRVVVDRAMLASFHKDEVFVVDWGETQVKKKFYKSTIPEIQITRCEACNSFFHEEDYEFEMLKGQGCPFCRTNNKQAATEEPQPAT
ncbi:intraflagellar transport protein [Acrasis kona]